MKRIFILLLTISACRSVAMDQKAHGIDTKHAKENSATPSSRPFGAAQPVETTKQKLTLQKLPDDVLEQITIDKIALEQNEKRMYILRHQKELFPAIVQLNDSVFGGLQFLGIHGFKRWIQDSMRYCTVNTIERLDWLNMVPGHLDKPKIVHYAHYIKRYCYVNNFRRLAYYYADKTTPLDPFNESARTIVGSMGEEVKPTQIVIAGFSDKTTAVYMNKEVLKSLAHNYSQEQLEFVVGLFNKPETAGIVLTDKEKTLFQSLDQHIQRCLKLNYDWIDFSVAAKVNKKTEPRSIQPVMGLDERIEQLSNVCIKLVSSLFACKRK